MKKLLLRAALLSVAILCGHASAQTSPAPSVVVSSDDLDLRTVAGRRALLARLDAGVRKVCPATARFEETLARRSCIRATTVDVRRKAKVLIARANQGRRDDSGLAAR